MREIVFRGKQTADGEWIIGDLHYGFLSKFPYINGFGVDVDTVGQFVGITDKNGVRIFEGDLIRWKNWKDEYCDSLVKYDAEWNRFCVWISGAESFGVNKHLSDDIEIVECKQNNIFMGKGE